jgi:hypothetical protein
VRHGAGGAGAVEHRLRVGVLVERDQHAAVPAAAVAVDRSRAVHPVEPTRAVAVLDRHAQRPPAPAATQLLDVAGRDDPPVLHDRDRVAQPLDQLELMTGEQHRHAARDLGAQHPAQHVDTDRVEAGERLVEHQQLRAMHERRRELHALLVAERQRLQLVARAIGQAEALEQLVAAGLRSGGAQPVQPREVDELVAHAHLRIEAALLRHVAEAAARVSVQRRAVPRHLARVGAEHAEDDPHRARLAGAVGSDEAGHAAGLHVEREAVERDDGAVAQVQVATSEHDGSG